MATDEILSKAKALLGTDYQKTDYQKRELPASAGSLTKAREILDSKSSLDIYVVFDTTGSMSPYISEVRDNIAQVTDALLDGKSDLRLSINGVGDHCDGDNVLQMYALSKDAAEVQGSIESIMMTYGGDEPEAYECLALSLAKRLPVESNGRKRAVVLIGDSIPHGMTDSPCQNNVNYQTAFESLKTVADGFYFVGCDQSTYHLQKQLVDSNNKQEQFIPLGDMAIVLPALLIALAKKTESEKAFLNYLSSLEQQNKAIANTVRGLLSR